jgi:hypothetical protein
MHHIDNLIERLESARTELSLALAYETKLISQSEQAIEKALKATKGAAKAASDVVNCKNSKELSYLTLQSDEKAHYARLFAAMARDAAELAGQAKQENAKIFLEVKQIAELIAIVLTDDKSETESTG